MTVALVTPDMGALLFLQSGLSIFVDRVGGGKSELDVVHGRVNRRIGVDVAFEDLLPTRSSLLVDALHGDLATSACGESPIRCFDGIARVCGIDGRDAEQRATAF